MDGLSGAFFLPARPEAAPVFDLLIGLMVMASVPAYFVLQPATVIRWRGKWRVAALAPLLVTVPALVFSLYALALDSNLWPLTLIFASAAGTLYLVAIWLVQGWRWT